MALDDSTPIDAWFAEVFGIDPVDVWSPVAHVTAHRSPRLTGWAGVFVFRRGAAMLVSAPDSVSARLRAELHGRTATDIELCDIVGGACRVLGPSWWSFADRVGVDDPARARRLGADDHDAIMRLRTAVGEADWDESGFSHDPATMFGVFDGDESLVAASNLTDWRDGADDVGVCTRPDGRGRGAARAAAGAAAADAVARTGVCRYRALTTNTASIRIAERLGFVHVGLQSAIVSP